MAEAVFAYQRQEERLERQALGLAMSGHLTQLAMMEAGLTATVRRLRAAGHLQWDPPHREASGRLRTPGRFVLTAAGERRATDEGLRPGLVIGRK